MIEREWDGKEWERFVLRLLRLKYPEDLQVVPDEDKGDAGVEAYTLSGVAYQAFAPQGAFTNQQLYEKQRDKLTEDIGKFRDNRKRLGAILGSVKIRRWVLLVPSIRSSKIVAHASKKTREVRQARLPYATPDFEVLVCTDEQYEVQRRQLQDAGLAAISIPTGRPNADEWQPGDSRWSANLERKLRRLPACEHDDERYNRTRQLMIELFLIGAEALDVLQSKYPDVFEMVEQKRADAGAFVELGNAISTDGPQQRLGEAFERFAREMQELSVINADTARKVAKGSVSEWLMSCLLEL